MKTRLTPALPSDLACAFYRAMLLDTLAAAGAAAAERRHLYWADPPSSAADLPPPAGGSRVAPATDTAELPSGFDSALQRGGNLGERLEAAFGELLAADARALIVGADCPELGAATLDQALAELDDHDLVLGPTRDGGYYLVGLAHPAPSLFRGVPWGSGEVLPRTLAAARRARLDVSLLDPLEDVDTPEDLVRLIARCLACPERAPRRTAEALARFGLLLPK